MDKKRIVSLLMILTIVFGNVVGSRTNADIVINSMNYSQNLIERADIDCDGINDFVRRLYSLALGRQPDDSGLESWANVLIQQKGTGISVAYGFIYSAEFQGRSVSNEEYVELMYQMFFGREADPSGKQGWVNVLESMDCTSGRLNVFNGFANSTEFFNLCRSYGIISGTFVEGREVDQVARVNLFVQRLYSVVLGRDCDKDGMAGWTNALLAGENTGAQAAQGFFFSPEYENAERSPEQYINDLYVAFMGRTADDAGRNSWISVLNSGGSREHVFNGFSQSQEFGSICENYGIERGGPIPEVEMEPTPTPTPAPSQTTPVPTISEDVDVKSELDRVRNDVTLLWNNVFCQVSHYSESGTSYTGGALDIDFVIMNMDEYFNAVTEDKVFIDSLGEEYNNIIVAFDRMYDKATIMHQYLLQETPRPNTPLPYEDDMELFKQYFDYFYNSVSDLLYNR